MKTELVPEKEFSTTRQLRFPGEWFNRKQNETRAWLAKNKSQAHPLAPTECQQGEDLADAHPFKKPLGALSRLFCVERRNPAVKIEV